MRVHAGLPAPGIICTATGLLIPARRGVAQTVTDFRPLIRAITSLPGWNGKPTAPQRPARIPPSLSKSDLLAGDGTIRWPGSDFERDSPAASAEGCGTGRRAVVREHATYGQATIRHVADARNKLTELCV